MNAKVKLIDLESLGTILMAMKSCVSAYQRSNDEGVVDSGMSCTGGRIITKEVTI